MLNLTQMLETLEKFILILNKLQSLNDCNKFMI